MPGLRRLRRAEVDQGSDPRAGHPSPQGADHLRHRLLVEPARVHPGLRGAQPARPRAARGHRRRPRQPRPPRDRGGRRRRRLRHRDGPLHPRHAPQPEPDLHRHGQRDLRPHHRPGLAHHDGGAQDQEHPPRERGEADPAPRPRPRHRRDLRGAGVLGGAEAPHPAHRRRHRAQGLLADRRLQPLRHLQQGQLVSVVQGAGLQARGRRRLRPVGPHGRAAEVDGVHPADPHRASLQDREADLRGHGARAAARARSWSSRSVSTARRSTSCSRRRCSRVRPQAAVSPCWSCIRSTARRGS